MRPDVTPEIEVAINALIRRETACLNDGDLDAWMALFTDDGYYWMPLEADQQSPDEHDSLIYDNRPLMEIRRILADLAIDAATANEYVVRTSVIAMINHKRQDVYGGRVTYRVCRLGDDWRIQCKRVDLLNADSPLDTIMMYI